MHQSYSDEDSDSEVESGDACDNCNCGSGSAGNSFMGDSVKSYSHSFICSVCGLHKVQDHFLCTYCIELVESEQDGRNKICYTCLLLSATTSIPAPRPDS